MSQLQIARATVASYISVETTRQFDIALHDAVATRADTMTDLQLAVRECVRSLKAANVGPVHMILAIKACALDSSTRHQTNRAYAASNAHLLIDKIVKWAIADYYRTDA